MNVENIACRICSNKSNKIFEAKILNKYNIGYFFCYKCGFLQTEDPYWLNEAYKNTIAIDDTGIMVRNMYFSNKAAIILYFFYDRHAKFLDYAGGYGIFTRLMRDIGFDFYWYDPYSQNLMAKGFEYRNDVDKIEVITTFECFEHLVDPIIEIEKMLSICKHIIFSTQILPEAIPKPGDWWYYGLHTGQHISFYSKKTLNFIEKKYKFNLYSLGGGLYLLTEKKIKHILLNISLQLGRFGILHYIKRNMKSKTFADRNYIISLENSKSL